jgi:signal transduction histidine kinase
MGGRGAGDVWRVVVPAAAVAIVQVVATLGAERHGSIAHVSALGWVMLLAGPAALAARRRHLVAAMWVTFVAAVLPWSPRLAYISLIVSFVLVTAAGCRRAAALMIVVGYTSLWWGPLMSGKPMPTLDQALLLGGWLVTLAVVGELVRARRDRAAAGLAARRAEERRRASEVRLRMARDLHDTVGHNIALISVQAGMGLDLIDTRPEQARAALAAIKTVSKEALNELRAVLADMRQEGEAAPRAPAPGLGPPAPGLARLDDLVATTRAAGLAVTVEMTGHTRAISSAVDLAAYRIVQESLTNVTRHAGPGTAVTIRIGHAPGRLRLQIADDGSPGADPGGAPDGGVPDGAGTGIAGMRERATALGGHLDAGSRPGGGFAVTAELPLGDIP